MSSPLLTATRLATFRRCQREQHLRFVEGYKPIIDSAALRLGALVHLGLEAWLLAPPGGREEAAIARMRAEPSEPFELARAEAMLRGYDAYWSVKHLEILAVEQPFNVPLLNPVTGEESQVWRLAGKIDAIGRDERGRVCIMEHKTSAADASPGSDYLRKLRTDAQVSIYFYGARSLGYDVEACIYDVLGKPLLRPLKAGAKRKADETADEFQVRCLEELTSDMARYYVRADVPRLEAEMDAALLDVWQWGRQLATLELRGEAPRNTDACYRFNSFCPFHGVCSGEASLDDPTLFTRSTDVHPELAGALVSLNPPKAKEEPNGDTVQSPRRAVTR